MNALSNTDNKKENKQCPRPAGGRMAPAGWGTQESVVVMGEADAHATAGVGA